ncbi:MAG: DUF2490 domain-containing protein [Candidatus Omnitrophica bacterium]|nr:DUF2490 domain-containing protein [Candidatus Omnitrophota bacterium]
MKRIIVLMMMSCFLITPPAQAEDDFQYWSRYSLKMVDTEKVDWTIFAEARFYNDTDDLGLYYISQRVSYDLWKHLSLGTNYTYLNYRTQSRDGTLAEDKFQHRLELEANPKFKWGERITFKNRNRVEFRWIEDKGSYNTRLRHRWTLSYALKDKGPVKDVYAESEFIYNIAEHAYDENRTIPIGATFKVNDKMSLKTFYMIQNKLGATDWYANQIFGTQISLQF